MEDTLYSRSALQARVAQALERSRVVLLAGPRQCGKTTLAREFVAADSPQYFDLENPLSLDRLAQPMQALEGLKGLVVIDEVQKRPDLFPVLRVLCDRRPLPAKFLILGSATPAMLRQAGESLLGRAETLEMAGLDLSEVSAPQAEQLWVRGGYPLSFLAKDEAAGDAWRQAAIQYFLERDLPELGIRIAPQTLRRFWAMLAHCHGQTWNGAEIAASLGVAQSTVRHYLDVLTGTYMVRQLQPWYENLGKRQVKSPKIYLRDSGMLHSLLRLLTAQTLYEHPKVGASWEGFVLEQALAILRPDEAYFWATHQGAELDLLLFKGGRRYGIEIKRADSVKLTASMKIAMTDLKLEKLFVVYPGPLRYPLAPGVEAVPLRDLETISLG